MIDEGHIRIVNLRNGGVMVLSSSLPVRKEDLPEYKKFVYLKGKAIWISEAARKYNLSTQNISNWVKSNIISKLDEKGRMVFVNEADVAYCAEIYHKNSGQGKRLFNPDGTPYTSRQRKRALPLAG